MTMLGMTNKKKTAMGGIGIAVLLTLLTVSYTHLTLPTKRIV